MSMPSVLFVLPVKGGGGGANSVVQESLGLSRLGVNTAIAVNRGNQTVFTTNYPEIQGKVRIEGFTPNDLAGLLVQYDIVVATIHTSVNLIEAALKGIAADMPRPAIAYYVQDYEPLFYHPDTQQWRDAHESYTLIPNMTLFAKTRWLQAMVYANHALPVARVEPSIDHDVFHPDLSRPQDGFSIVAMVRPQTPRRAPQRTLRIMDILASRYGDNNLSLQIFGASTDELAEAGLHHDPVLINRGRLRRIDVPHFLRHADLFLDLSDYQAFGRTALEAMASGCVSVVPILGGADEYAIHGYNAYVVDTRSDAAILQAIGDFIELPPESRQKMQMNALNTASRYTIKRAALSELRVFQAMM